MIDFTVKVHRYDHGAWDGWFFSKVYAIRRNKEKMTTEFLVYDNGFLSADDSFVPGFYWEDAERIMPDINDTERYMPVVELVEDGGKEWQT